METITLLTRLCKIRENLKQLSVKSSFFFRGDITVEELYHIGYSVTYEEELKKLFAEIKETRELVDDAIRHAARDLTEEEV